MLSLLVPADLLAEIGDAVARQNRNTRGVPLNRSAWLRRAIRWELDRAARSRAKRRKRMPPNP